MPTRWNPDWPEWRKEAEREKRRRKYALKRLNSGKTYKRLDGPIEEPGDEVDTTDALNAIEKAILEKLMRKE